MRALYDRSARLTAWTDGQNLFDLKRRWIAYVRRSHLWRAADHRWVRSVHGSSILDDRGRPLLWFGDGVPEGRSVSYRPILGRPLNAPSRPRPVRVDARPAPPPTPAGGWSKRSFALLFGIEAQR